MSIIEKAAGKLEKERNNDAGRIQRDAPISSGQRIPMEGEAQSGTSQAVLAEPDIVSARAPAQTSRRIILNIERMRQYGIVTPDQGRTQIASLVNSNGGESKMTTRSA